MARSFSGWGGVSGSFGAWAGAESAVNHLGLDPLAWMPLYCDPEGGKLEERAAQGKDHRAAIRRADRRPENGGRSSGFEFLRMVLMETTKRPAISKLSPPPGRRPYRLKRQDDRTNPTNPLGTALPLTPATLPPRQNGAPTPRTPGGTGL